jgi:hypothetical protein
MIIDIYIEVVEEHEININKREWMNMTGFLNEIVYKVFICVIAIELIN